MSAILPARTFAAAVAAMAVAACTGGAGKPDANAAAPLTTGQILALTACPHRIAEANAWVNLMPGPLQGARDLHVVLVLKDRNDNAVLLKAANQRPGELALDLRAAPTSAKPGEAAFREPVSTAWPTRISILCRGGEIHAITEIVAAR